MTVPEEIGTGQSYRLEIEKAYTDRKPKGQGGFKINNFGITIAETRGHVLSPYSGRAKSGPRSKMGLGNGYGRITDRIPYGCLRTVRPCKLRPRQLGFVLCLVRVS
jgi:hypothetical protein